MSGPDRGIPDPSPGERRRLDRAPGERFATAAAAAPVPAAQAGRASVRGLLAGALVAAIGAVAFFVLGQLDVGAGLLAVAAFTGWMTAVALVDLGWGTAMRPGAARIVLAAGLAGGAILAAILLDWAWAAMQGGVLGPLDYVGARYGPAALLDVAVAGTLAGLHAR